MAVKILMVCLGNICRSPLAEGLLADKLPKDKFYIDSAGTGNYHIGKQPDKRSIDTALKNGLNISNQKARQFTSKDFDAFEIILPDIKTLNQFDEITTPMIEQIVNNRLENKRLSFLRDTLLPKLMSGELDVSGIDL